MVLTHALISIGFYILSLIVWYLICVQECNMDSAFNYTFLLNFVKVVRTEETVEAEFYI